MKRRLAALSLAACLLAGCGAEAEPMETAALTEVSIPTETPANPEPKEAETMTVTIGEQSFFLILEENDTAEAFRELFPVTLDMQELNGNEKYIYLDAALPSAPQAIGEIHAGDLMLFGNSCVVLFYQSFSTAYSYTRIGHLENSDGLAAAAGSGTASVVFAVRD